MLTSFFNKSKPINFLGVGVFMSVYYVLENFVLRTNVINMDYVFRKTGFLFLYLFLMVLINFIVKRNEVTQRNTFTIFLFALFTVSFPAILKNESTLLSSLFLLLALRRILSLKTGAAIKSKIFDASLWIVLASFFYTWNILFFVIVFLAILLYAANDYRHWFIPFLPVFCVYILSTCFYLLTEHQFFPVFQFFSLPNFDYAPYGELSLLLPLSFLLTFTLWIFIDYLWVIKNASKKLKASLLLVLAIWLIAIPVVLFSPIKDGSEFLFFIIPISVVGARYFQRGKDKRFNEVLLFTLLIMTLLLPFWS